MSKRTFSNIAKRQFLDTLTFAGSPMPIIVTPPSCAPLTQSEHEPMIDSAVDDDDDVPFLDCIDDDCWKERDINLTELLKSLDSICETEEILHEAVIIDESDMPDVGEVDPIQLSLSEELLIFFVMFNLPKSAMSYLLQLLVRHKIDVPSSVYLLTKVKRNIKWDILDIDKGQFGTLSLKDTIVYCLQNGLLVIDSGLQQMALNIKINVDGLPLFKSSLVSLWPILCSIGNVARPLPLGLFCGIGKPDLDVFLRSLCAELDELMTTGFVASGCHFTIQNVVFICDAPARAFLQCVKSHTSKDGCGYCRIKGIWCDNRVVFPFGPCETRSSEMYQLGTESNQLRVSPLSRLIDLQTAFPPEYMHSVCCAQVISLSFDSY
jgi:hypothetical protein